MLPFERAQVAIAQSFGLRRESIVGGKYQLKDISIFRSTRDGHLYASVIEKGGRFREAPCLCSRETEIAVMFPNMLERPHHDIEDYPRAKEEFKELYEFEGSAYMFDRYSKAIDNHAFRSEYAMNLYKERQEEYDESSRETYRGYGAQALKEVSEALGHSRMSVVVEHYMNK